MDSDAVVDSLLKVAKKWKLARRGQQKKFQEEKQAWEKERSQFKTELNTRIDTEENLKAKVEAARVEIGRLKESSQSAAKINHLNLEHKKDQNDLDSLRDQLLSKRRYIKDLDDLLNQAETAKDKTTQELAHLRALVSMNYPGDTSKVITALKDINDAVDAWRWSSTVWSLMIDEPRYSLLPSCLRTSKVVILGICWILSGT